MNDNEIQQTAHFEGRYSPEEVELNKQLYEVCSKEPPDIVAAEDLLRQGADPLGATATSGWGLFDHVYGELLCDSQNSNSIYLPQITELFLKYGMDIDNPRVPYDNDESLNPMWQFSFLMNENSVFALELLLEHGLSADAVAEMWRHAIFDLLNVGCGNPCDGDFWNYECTWFMKLTMLCASYEHVLNNDAELQKFINCSGNHYDLQKFRKWNDFDYIFDVSTCRGRPELYGSTVRIYEKTSGKEVWSFYVE